jgi:hypothetical protein
MFLKNGRGVNPIHTPGGVQEMLCLSEQGLYFFLGRSDKEAALPFQKWYAGEVLPQIRKTGFYTPKGRYLNPENIESARIMLDRARDTERIYDQKQEEKIRLFFNMFIYFTENKGDYLLVKEVYEKYADETEHYGILSRFNFTYRLRRMFPNIEYGQKKVHGYPQLVFYGVRFLH